MAAARVSPQGDASEGDGLVDGTWAIVELIDAALATQPTPVPTVPERRKVIKVERGESI
jgi:hypothetical protein